MSHFSRFVSPASMKTVPRIQNVVISAANPIGITQTDDEPRDFFAKNRHLGSQAVGTRTREVAVPTLMIVEPVGVSPAPIIAEAGRVAMAEPAADC